jgi:C4-dicarboxylate transporter DctQ subunit
MLNIIILIAKNIKLISYFVNKIAKYLCVLCGLGILIMVDILVFSRYILNIGPMWADITAGFLMIWAVFMGASIGLKEKGLAKLDIISDIFCKNSNNITLVILDNIKFVLILGFLGYFLVYGKIALKFFSRETANCLEISYLWPALGMYIGIIFMFIHVLNDFINGILSLFKIQK